MTRGLRRGFTLVELAVVITLMGLLVGVTAPALSSLSREATSPADALTRVLTEARRHALTNAVSVEVVVDPAGHRLWVRSTGTAANVDTTFRLDSADQYAAVRQRPHFTFHANGTAWGDTVAVTRGGRVVLVSVAPLDGEILASTPGSARQP